MATPAHTHIHNLPRDVLDVHGALTKHTFNTVTLDLSCRFSYSELAKLYRMIETALPGNPHRIVQFVSALNEEGASEIALETAILVAKLTGKRVLFINTSTTRDNKRKKRLPGSPTVSLDTLLLTGGSPYEAIARAVGTELYFAMLCERDSDGFVPVSLNAIEKALEGLRLNFDLIIVDSQKILSDAFGMALTKFADGSVMVIEAERTRGLVAEECKRLIEGSGGRLIGAVMNRRRFYIPDAIYRLFYQRSCA